MDTIECRSDGNDTIHRSNEWEFSLSNYLYLLADDVYSIPIFTADRKHLHLEGRYNYEDFRTGSVFCGYNFSMGKKFKFKATPVLGVVFGNTNGIAPGLILDMYYWKLNLYSESEYLFDFSGKESFFYYNWSELKISPVEWMQFGISVQRTKVYKTGLEIERGVVLGFTIKFLSVSGYYFNPGTEDKYGILAVALEF